MHPAASLMMLLSVLIPSHTWYPVNQPIDIQVRGAGASAGGNGGGNGGGDVTLVLTDFDGKAIDSAGGAGSADVAAGATADIHKLFLATFAQPGDYLLWATPKGKTLADFQGTPLVVEIRPNVGPEAAPGPTVVKIEPLVYAAIDTDQGPMSAIFFYDGAPNTVDHFIKLTENGFYDGLTFHRIIPGFIIQGGDPRGDGTGGPGYEINAEFNNHLHLAGALSMARETDPMEQNGGAPRPQYANSAGSQFFISLDHEKTRSLDHHYTVFGTIVHGMATVNKIAALPLADPTTDRPKDPPVIRSITIKPVTPRDDPYATMLHLPETSEPATAPTTEPTTASTTESVAEPTSEATTEPAAGSMNDMNHSGMNPTVPSDNAGSPEEIRGSVGRPRGGSESSSQGGSLDASQGVSQGGSEGGLTAAQPTSGPLNEASPATQGMMPATRAITPADLPAGPRPTTGPTTSPHHFDSEYPLLDR